MPMPIRRFVYEDNIETLRGRTPHCWDSVILSFVIFYMMLILASIIGLVTLCIVLTYTGSTWKLTLISTNPNLIYQPMSDSAIEFNRNDSAEVGHWTDLLDNFLAPYNATPSSNQRVCSFGQPNPATNVNSMPVCLVDIGEFEDSCSPATRYGYKSGRPCVILRLGRIYGWVPKFYGNLTDLPEDMPADLKEYIANVPATERQQVWVSCTGQQQQKHPVNNVTYVGSRGFPSYYYPYLNQPGYLSPLVAVQFQEITVSQLIAIECRAWAKNIIYRCKRNRARLGSVSFKFLMQ